MSQKQLSRTPVKQVQKTVLDLGSAEYLFPMRNSLTSQRLFDLYAFYTLYTDNSRLSVERLTALKPLVLG